LSELLALCGLGVFARDLSQHELIFAGNNKTKPYPMEQKRQQALALYLNQFKTQREIAQIIGVSERTIYTWIRKYAWDKLRQATCQAPAMIAENLCSQLVELQNAIARREPGCRYPTKDESQIMHRLVIDIEKMQKSPSLSVNMQVLESFRSYIRKFDKDLAGKFAIHANLFIEASAVNGYYPFQVQFGAEKVSPVSPFYDEEPDDQDYEEYYRKNCFPEPEAQPDPASNTVDNQDVSVNDTSEIHLQLSEEVGSRSALQALRSPLNYSDRYRSASNKKETRSKEEVLAQQMLRWQNFVQTINEGTAEPPQDGPNSANAGSKPEV
jgi:transposase